MALLQALQPANTGFSSPGFSSGNEVDLPLDYKPDIKLISFVSAPVSARTLCKMIYPRKSI